MSEKIIIATRKSELALWQANFVSQKLNDLGYTTELLGIKTKGDLNLKQPLAEIGGKGLFIKELELAILENRADIAVHSMKDMPHTLAQGLTIPCYLERDNPSDCLIISKTNLPQSLAISLIDEFDSLAEIDTQLLKKIPDTFSFGTSSLRRSSQILRAKPNFKIIPIRGNLNTRIAKLDNGDCDGLVLARSGVDRLMSPNRANQNKKKSLKLNKERYFIINFSHQLMIPAISQGVIGIECASNQTNKNKELIAQLKKIDNFHSRIALTAERIINQKLEGSCSSTLCAFAEISNDEIKVTARVLAHDGSDCLEVSASGKVSQTKEIGIHIAKKLVKIGAQKYLIKHKNKT